MLCRGLHRGQAQGPPQARAPDSRGARRQSRRERQHHASVERNEVEPHGRTIRKLAEALDVDPAELVKTEG